MVLTEHGLRCVAWGSAIFLILAAFGLSRLYEKKKVADLSKHMFHEGCWERYGSEYCVYVDMSGERFCTKETGQKVEEITCD